MTKSDAQVLREFTEGMDLATDKKEENRVEGAKTLVSLLKSEDVEVMGFVHNLGNLSASESERLLIAVLNELLKSK